MEKPEASSKKEQKGRILLRGYTCVCLPVNKRKRKKERARINKERSSTINSRRKGKPRKKEGKYISQSKKDNVRDRLHAPSSPSQQQRQHAYRWSGCVVAGVCVCFWNKL